MKWLQAVIVETILCLLFFTSATAEDSKIDTSNMSTEALISLQKEITAQLFNNNQLISLPAGEYVAGRDIAAGSYDVTFLKNKSIIGAITLTIYNTPDARVKHESAFKDYQIKWGLIRESMQAGTPIQLDIPEIFDESQYYISCYEQSIYPNTSIHISIADGQMLYINYKSIDFYVIIEKSPTLFME